MRYARAQRTRPQLKISNSYICPLYVYAEFHRNQNFQVREVSFRASDSERAEYLYNKANNALALRAQHAGTVRNRPTGFNNSCAPRRKRDLDG